MKLRGTHGMRSLQDAGERVPSKEGLGPERLVTVPEDREEVGNGNTEGRRGPSIRFEPLPGLVSPSKTEIRRLLPRPYTLPHLSSIPCDSHYMNSGPHFSGLSRTSLNSSAV